MEYPCNNCCTSDVFWKTGCLNECKVYKKYLREMTTHYRKYGELPRYEFRDIVKFRYPQ